VTNSHTGHEGLATKHTKFTKVFRVFLRGLPALRGYRLRVIVAPLFADGWINSQALEI